MLTPNDDISVECACADDVDVTKATLLRERMDDCRRPVQKDSSTWMVDVCIEQFHWRYFLDYSQNIFL